MERLLPTTFPVWTVKGGHDILPTHDNKGHEVVPGVGEVGCIAKRRDSREASHVHAHVLSYNTNDSLLM